MSRIRARAGTGFRTSERDVKFTKWTVPMGVAAPGFGAAGLADDLTHFPVERGAGPAAVAATSRGIANSLGDDENSTMPAA